MKKPWGEFSMMKLYLAVTWNHSYTQIHIHVRWLMLRTSGRLRKVTWKDNLTTNNDFRAKIPVALAFKKGSAFFSSYQIALKKMEETGVLDRIQEKYFTYDKDNIKCDPPTVRLLGISHLLTLAWLTKNNILLNFRHGWDIRKHFSHLDALFLEQ